MTNKVAPTIATVDSLIAEAEAAVLTQAEQPTKVAHEISAHERQDDLAAAAETTKKESDVVSALGLFKHASNQEIALFAFGSANAFVAGASIPFLCYCFGKLFGG